jgi:hypothetical protein
MAHIHASSVLCIAAAYSYDDSIGCFATIPSCGLEFLDSSRNTREVFARQRRLSDVLGHRTSADPHQE